MRRTLATWVAACSLGACAATALPSPAAALHVEGTGTVTVIFEAGLGDTGSVWRPVQSAVALNCARTVSYGRAGYAPLSSAKGRRDAERIVAELRQHLAQAGLPPPYVLVGHSLGGLYMQYFARRYPADVQGLVLVDSTHWDQLGRLKATEPGLYRVVKSVAFVSGGIVRRELIDSPAAGDEVEALPRAESVPTIVLSSTRAAMGETAAFRELAARLQDEIAAAYATRRHTFVAESGHYIQRDQPQEVIRAARELAGCDGRAQP